MSEDLISNELMVTLIERTERLDGSLTPITSAIAKHLADLAPVVRVEPREHPTEADRSVRFWRSLGKKIKNGSRVPDGYDRTRR